MDIKVQLCNSAILTELRHNLEKNSPFVEDILNRKRVNEKNEFVLP